MKLRLTAKIKRLGTIGPHEGKELELMLTGKKPAALLDARKLKSFEPYIKNKILVLVGSIPNTDVDGRYAVTLPGEEQRGERIIELFKNGLPEPQDTIPSEDHMRNKKQKYYYEFHTELGRLLEYSEEDIEDFFNNRRSSSYEPHETKP